MFSDGYFSLTCILLMMQPVDQARYSVTGVWKLQENYSNVTDDNTTSSCADPVSNISVPHETLQHSSRFTQDYTTSHNLADGQDYNTSYTVAHVQTNYCSARCHGSVQLYLQSGNVCSDKRATCYPCDCRRPQCEVYGTCCPNITSRKMFNRNSYKNNSQESPRKQVFLKPSAHNKLICDDHSLPETSFLCIRSCPVGFSDGHIRRLCEDNIPVPEQTMETFARVSDDTAGIVYYNKYCAECQQVLQSTAWELSASCEHYLRVYSARNKDELFHLSQRRDSLCTILQHPPSGDVLHSCTADWHGQVIASCNETGQWTVSDTDTAARCDNPTDLSSRVRVTHENASSSYYKNIFCAICNSDSNLLYQYSCKLQNGSVDCCSTLDVNDFWSGRMIPPFSLLLGSLGNKHIAPSDPGMTFKDCDVSQWPSPDGTCLPLRCTAGKYLKDGKCKTAVQDITGLGYRATMLFMPKTKLTNDIHSYFLDQRNSSKILNVFIIHLKEQQIFSPSVAESEMAVSLVWEGSNLRNLSGDHSEIEFVAISNYLGHSATLSMLDHSRFYFYVEAFFLANKSISRDRFEQTFLTPFLMNIPEIEIEENFTVHLVPKLVPHVPDLSESSCHFLKEKSQTIKVQTEVTCKKNHLNDLIWGYKREFIFSSRTLTCVEVSFNKSQYTVSVNCTIFPPTWQIELILNEIKLTFSEASDLSRLTFEDDNENSGGHMRACVELLEEAIQRLKTNSDPSDLSGIDLWLYYLTHACLGMSLLALLMTLVVYSLFPCLRNEAGTNNMFLAATLLLAQASLLASAHMQSSSLLCTAVGISTHFLWLSMITWSFICCFHMFRVFGAKTGVFKCSASTQRNNQIKKAAAGFIVPASIIVMVMASTYFTSGGQRIGYTDSSPCYLDSNFLAVISLATPLGLVTLANICFFASTVHNIQTVQKLQTHTEFKKKERQTFIIYMKLSSLTGAFWAIAIISEHTDNDPLRFIAIFLNGLQGVFLFWSFVCTSRVARLFCKVIRPEKCSAVTHSSKGTGESSDKTREKSSAL
ncbi:hypothetical protein BsWGS_04159 [Bradybaena similaris]